MGKEILSIYRQSNLLWFDDDGGGAPPVCKASPPHHGESPLTKKIKKISKSNFRFWL